MQFYCQKRMKHMNKFLFLSLSLFFFFGGGSGGEKGSPIKGAPQGPHSHLNSKTTGQVWGGGSHNNFRQLNELMSS